MRTPKQAKARALSLIRRDEVVAKLCQGLAKGIPLSTLCISPDMPARGLVQKWMVEDPELTELMDQARNEGADVIAQDCISIVDNLNEDPASRRIRVETRLKLLAKWFPKRYGDKVEVEQSGTVNMVVSIGGNA